VPLLLRLRQLLHLLPVRQFAVTRQSPTIFSDSSRYCTVLLLASTWSSMSSTCALVRLTCEAVLPYFCCT
jgi:hypothetical protein